MKTLNDDIIKGIFTLIKNKFVSAESVEEVEGLSVETTPTNGSSNLITSGGVYNHTSDSGIHVTATEKSTWNSKANIGDIPTKMSDLEQDVETGKIDAIKVNNVAQTITDKTVNISVPTTLSGLTNDANYVKAQNPSGTTDIATINADTLDGHPASYFAKASDVTPIDYVRNDDYRLSNARTPIAHTHSEYLSSDDVDDVKTEILSDVYTKEESYSAEQIDNAISSKANKPTKTTYTLLASKWDSDKKYSFENIYSSNEYDVDIQISSSATEEQLTAWSSAKIVSSNDLTNVIIATGEKPNVDIPTILVVNNISDTLEDSEGNIVTNYAIKSHIENTTMHVTASEKELWDSKVDDFDPRLAKVETMLGGITNLETYIRDIVMQVLSEQ